MHQAEALLRDIRTIQLEDETDDSIQAILAKGGREVVREKTSLCSGDDDEYYVVVKNPTLDWLGIRSSVLRPFGNRVWKVDANAVMSHGQPCALRFQIVSFREHELVLANVTYERDYPSINPYEGGYRKYKGSDWLQIQLTTRSTPEQRKSVFETDLSCLKRLWGCLSACEVMPAVWQDYQIEARQQGWPLPADEANDARCRRLP
jgi:hypothetical protein